MKIRTATVLASALVLGAALGVHGCVDDRASLQVQLVCAPPDTCAFSGKCDAQYISWPTLDVGASARDALTLYVQVENQLPDNEDLEDLARVNTNDAHVDETVIEYEGVALPEVRIGSNFHVPAAGTSVVKVEVIPDALNAGATLGALAPGAEPREIVATLRLRGYYDDGTRFETGEFPITVRVCTGCIGATQQCAVGAATCPPESNGQLPLTCVQ